MTRAGEPPPATTDAAVLRRRIAELESEKLELVRQRDELARVKAEMSFDDLARSLGRAATVAEAAAPDRAVRSLSATIRAHFTPSPEGVAVRFQPPELGAQTAALGTASDEFTGAARARSPSSRREPRRARAGRRRWHRPWR